jgi:competence protein ComGC
MKGKIRFTPIELMIITLVIAIGLSIAIPNILIARAAREQTKARTCKHQMLNIEWAKRLLIDKKYYGKDLRFDSAEKPSLAALQKCCKTKLVATCPCGEPYKIGSISGPVECPKHGCIKMGQIYRYKQP